MENLQITLPWLQKILLLGGGQVLLCVNEQISDDLCNTRLVLDRFDNNILND